MAAEAGFRALGVLELDDLDALDGLLAHPEQAGGHLGNHVVVVRLEHLGIAALAGQLFPHAPIGVLAPSACADLIFVDYPAFTPVTPENLPWHIVFGFHESMVTTTIAAGKVLMRDNTLLTMDEAAIAARARQLAPQVWERYQSYVPAD